MKLVIVLCSLNARARSVDVVLTEIDLYRYTYAVLLVLLVPQFYIAAYLTYFRPSVLNFEITAPQDAALKNCRKFLPLH
jgi:hypothetical protein